MYTKIALTVLVGIVLTFVGLTSAQTGGNGSTKSDIDKEQLASKTRQIFEKYCYRCHGQNGSGEGGLSYILDFTKLIAEEQVISGNAKGSYLFERLESYKDMPPRRYRGKDYTGPRPNKEEIELVRLWINAGAPAAKITTQRPFVTLEDELLAMSLYLAKLNRDDRGFIRFFTLRHLSNMPVGNVSDIDLRVYRAALSKLINSLSWKATVVVPETVDKHGILFAIDVRQLDWDRDNLWKEILNVYPYGLEHNRNPSNRRVNDLYDEVVDRVGSRIPVVRADWFVATASRPPLYHHLLQLPKTVGELQKKLGVNAQRNILTGQVHRAGFNASGVSGHNRLVERHASLYGAYWESYDFDSSTGRNSLLVFPLGPKFAANPFSNHAFVHAGGEMIFNLPNGMQGYFLADGQGRRIDAGPIKIVSDPSKISGTPEVINGLSCMACHQHGMIPFKDQVRTGHILGGTARDFVERIYPEAKEMTRLVNADKERFLSAVNKATGPFLKVGPDADKEITGFPESISAIAQWYLSQDLSAVEAARELGLKDATLLKAAVANNTQLQRLGLYPLSRGGTVKREVWEDVSALRSPFQRVAAQLRVGTPSLR